MNTAEERRRDLGDERRTDYRRNEFCVLLACDRRGKRAIESPCIPVNPLHCPRRGPFVARTNAAAHANLFQRANSRRR